MTENPDLLAARTKADLAAQANETKPGEGWVDTAPNYDPQPEHRPGSGGLGYVPGGADLERDDTITAPVPDWLIPEKAKAAAFKWNTLDERLDKAEDELRAARAAAASAPAEDRSARRTALAAGKRYSGTPVQDKPAERLRGATENMRVLNEITREAGRALINTLRDNRSDVLRLTNARLTPALSEARRTAAQAEAAMRAAAAEEAEANSGLTLIKGLDSNESEWLGAFTEDVPTPDFAKHHQALNIIESNSEAVIEPLTPSLVRVRTANGLEMNVKPHIARILISQGAEEIPVYAGISGLPEAERGSDSFSS